jgi:PAS domain-containing protein
MVSYRISNVPIIRGGKTIGTLEIATDLTLQKNTEKALEAQTKALKEAEGQLRQSEGRFSLFTDFLPAIVFLKDAQGRILFTYKYMDTVLGSSGWKGKIMAEAHPGEAGQRSLADDMASLKAGYGKTEAETYLDGSRHSDETQRFVFSGSKGEPLLGGFSLVITERKRTERLLRDSEERMKFALEGSELGEWDWNLKTGTIKRNERWAQMLGYSLAEMEDNLQQGVEL